MSPREAQAQLLWGPASQRLPQTLVAALWWMSARMLGGDFASCAHATPVDNFPPEEAMDLEKEGFGEGGV